LVGKKKRQEEGLGIEPNEYNEYNHVQNVFKYFVENPLQTA